MTPPFTDASVEERCGPGHYVRERGQSRTELSPPVIASASEAISCREGNDGEIAWLLAMTIAVDRPVL